MKESLQRKIQAHKQSKATRSSFEGFISEKKKKMQELIKLDEEDLQTEKENEFTTNQYSKMIGLKQREYFNQMEELQGLKLKSIELQNQLEHLKIQTTFQNKSLQNLGSQLQKQKIDHEALLSKVTDKHSKEYKETKKVYEQRLKKNLEHYEGLLSEKAQQNERRLKFIQNKKFYEEKNKSSKEGFNKDLIKNKQLWMQQQKELRDKWEQKKKQEILQNTLRGIEPQIQRIVGKSKQEIKKIEERYEILKEEYRNEKQSEFEKKSSQIRNELFQAFEAEKMQTLNEYAEKLKQQFETLEQQFERDRKKIRSQRQQEIKELEEKRKKETQEFISKNKDFYITHLDEVRQLKEKYQKEIKQLDGKFEEEVEKEEIQIRQKYHTKLQKQRQLARKQLQSKIKKYTQSYQKQSEEQYEDIVQKVAVDNEVYESGVRKRTNERIRELRENCESECKSLRKTIAAVEAKIKLLKGEGDKYKGQFDENQQHYEDSKRQNEYLMKKLTEYQVDVREKQKIVDGMSSESGLYESNPQLKRIQNDWNEQLETIKKSYRNLQNEMVQEEEIMNVKISELRKQYSETTNDLEKNGLKIINLKKNELVKLKADRDMQVKYGEGLNETIKKQREMMKKYQQMQGR